MDDDGIAAYTLLLLVLFPAGIAVSAITGYPIDAFVLTLLSAVLIVVFAASVLVARGFLRVLAPLGLFWAGVVLAHVGLGGIV